MFFSDIEMVTTMIGFSIHNKLINNENKAVGSFRSSTF